MKTKQQALNQYIKDKKTQDECSGFIDGWEEAEYYLSTQRTVDVLVGAVIGIIFTSLVVLFLTR
jgi:hypothetical protein